MLYTHKIDEVERRRARRLRIALVIIGLQVTVLVILLLGCVRASLPLGPAAENRVGTVEAATPRMSGGPITTSGPVETRQEQTQQVLRDLLAKVALLEQRTEITAGDRARITQGVTGWQLVACFGCYFLVSKASDVLRDWWRIKRRV